MSPSQAKPRSSQWLSADLEQELKSFVDDVNRDVLVGSLRLSKATVKMVLRLVGQANWANAADLMALLGQRLARGFQDDPGQAVVGNLVRRVLKLIREEHAMAIKQRGGDNNKQVQGGENTQQQQQQEEIGLHSMVQSQTDSSNISSEESHDLTLAVPGLKSKILESVDELLCELEAASEEISVQALEHIHANEVILTVGRSRTVEAFLKQAAKERKFQVIVAECGPPGFRGQEMASSLASSGIATTVITDSAIFAMMSRVNKVIVGTAAILADGGLKAVAGTYTAALSAKHYSVPLYVCAAITKLTPRYCTSNDLVDFNRFASPEGSMVGLDGPLLSALSSATPVYEYVPPKLVTLFISNLSGHAPSYVYRLLSELYHPNDYDFEDKS